MPGTRTILLLAAAVLAVIQPPGDGPLLFLPEGANFYVYSRGGMTLYLNSSRATRLQIGKSLEKLASGKRINRAGDDAAGLAVSEKIKSIVDGMKRSSLNLADWRNYLRFRESALAHTSSALQRMRELALRASNGILSADDREIIQGEIDLLTGSVDSSARFTLFNSLAVIEDCTAEGLGVKDVNVVRDPNGAIMKIDGGLHRIQYLRTKAGVQENVMTWRMEGAELRIVNLVSAYSRISDLDMAEEIGELVRSGVLLKTQYGTVLRGVPIAAPGGRAR
jgi:flagellin